MRNLRTILMMISLFFLATTLYAFHEPFRTDQEAYQLGYEEGYKHGEVDHEMGLNFNYMHNHEFPSGISYDSYVNVNFRAGYEEGYRDGYGSRSSHVGESQGHFHSSGGRGFATAFTRLGFRGAVREFGIGRYPYLEGRWNDSISSVELSGPIRVILFDDSNFRGQQLILEQDSPNLDDLNFASRAASMIVEPVD